MKSVSKLTSLIGLVFWFGTASFGMGGANFDQEISPPGQMQETESVKLSTQNLKADLRTDPIGLPGIPRLSWEIHSSRRNTYQVAYRIRCFHGSKKGGRASSKIWDSGKIEAAESQFVKYAGPVPEPGRKIFWQVRIWDNHGRVSGWSEPASWQLGFADPSRWKAQWIEADIPENTAESTPCPFLRKTFELKKRVEAATIYVTAHGLYELHLNGRRVGEDYFTPGWTSYDHRLQYQVYDVSDDLVEGPNALGAILGDGWYRGYLGWQGEKNFYGDKASLLLQLEILYSDGERELICSDGSWKSNTGPVLKSDFQNGEIYDARLEMVDWNLPGGVDNDWSAVKISDIGTEKIIPMAGVPVRIQQTVRPVRKFMTPRGELVFDFGQNMVGWVRFSLSGERGSRIVIHHAEVLDQEGYFYTDNLRAARAEDVYVFKGEGVENHEPRFTFHGFRYIRISEYEGEISVNDLEGVVLASEVERTGHFECSDSLVNRLQENIVWGLYGNFVDVPTDCPQRDERLGWTGDAQVITPTACFNVNALHFFRKWLGDLAVDQRGDGSVPWVVPNVVPDGGGTGWSDGYGATGWADAAVIIPWILYRVYGDVGVLEEQYASMKAWVEYMIRESGSSLIFKSGFHFGDWLSFAEYHSYRYNAPDYGYAGAHTSKDLIATAYFYHSTGILKQVTGILGKSEDANRYSLLEGQIREAFAKEFISPAGRMVSETQTAYVLALAFGILPPEYRETMARRLADDVDYFGHLTTGFLGTPLLCQALSDNGYPELAMKLLLNKRYPSWLYPVTLGATTIWERWDGIRPDGSFQDPGMNSFNHYAYGAIGYWLYSRLAGIRPDMENPGYKRIHIAPLFVRELDYVKSHYRSGYGQIHSAWQRDGDELELRLTIPPNCDARISLPVADPGLVTESGVPVDRITELAIEQQEGGSLSILTGSGDYVFRFPEK